MQNSGTSGVDDPAKPESESGFREVIDPAEI
jgi:hypothetical protein